MTDAGTAQIELAKTDQDLRALVKPDPYKPGRAFWRLLPSERPIWAIIMHLLTFVEGDDPTEATDDQIRQTADDYAISEIEVRAALAYYERNKKYIDAWLTINFDWGEDE
jgi:hypothetical protein